MKTFFALCTALFCFTFVNAQATKSNPGDDNKVLTIVQQQPKFQGDINKWLADNIKYPADAIQKNIEGTVFVSFVIEKDGSVSTVKILRGVNKLLDDEATRVVSIMPKWTPGEQDGKKVRVQYNIPIRFVLKDEKASQPAKN